MKKLLTVFLSMCLLLSCAFALGEGEAQAFDAVGLRLGFSDVSEPSPYYVNLASGTLSRSPFISVLQLQYFAIPRETMQTMLDSYDDYDEDYVDFLYDSQERAVALEVEPGLRPSARYRRYKVLFDSDYVYYGAVEE